MSRDHDHDANTLRHILPSVTRHMTMTQTHYANTWRHILPSVTRHTTHDTRHTTHDATSCHQSHDTRHTTHDNHIFTLIDWDITPHIYPSFMLWTPPTHYFNFYFDRNSNLFSHTLYIQTAIMYLLWALRDRIAFTLLRRHLFADFDFDFDFDFTTLFPPFLLLHDNLRPPNNFGSSKLIKSGCRTRLTPLGGASIA